MAEPGYFCIVTAHNASGEGAAQSNDLLQVYLPNSLVIPAASGNRLLGNLLSVNDGTWLHSPTTFARQWKRAPNTSIPSANAATYSTVPADLGHSIFCTVTATNGAGPMSVNSNLLGPIVVAPSNLDAPDISGTIGVEVGSLMTCTEGLWQATPLPEFTYQWKTTPMAEILGATDPTFALTVDQLGLSVYCTVRATNDFGTSTADSNILGPVTNPATALTVWNPADKTSNIVLSGGNLTASTDSSAGFVNQGVRGTVSRSTGKRYFEVTMVGFGDTSVPEANIYVGVADATAVLGNAVGFADSQGATLQCHTGVIAGSQTGGLAWYPTPGITLAEGDVVGCAVDLDTRTAWWYKNGVMIKAGADPNIPATGINWGSTPAAAMFPYLHQRYQGFITIATTTNFGSLPFALAPLPTDYVAWG